MASRLSREFISRTWKRPSYRLQAFVSSRAPSPSSTLFLNIYGHNIRLCTIINFIIIKILVCFRREKASLGRISGRKKGEKHVSPNNAPGPVRVARFEMNIICIFFGKCRGILEGKKDSTISPDNEPRQFAGFFARLIIDAHLYLIRAYIVEKSHRKCCGHANLGASRT